MMSEITVRCLRCDKRHGLGTYNAKVYGPVIEVSCPFCKKIVVRNLGKFVDKQIPSDRKMGRFERFETMRTLAREMIKELE